MKKKRLIAGLVIANVGVFIIATAWLPQAPSYTYYGPVSRIINSRLRWDIPCLVTLGTTLVSVGLVFALRKDEDESPPTRNGGGC